MHRHRWRWAALATLLTAEAMNLLDATIVQVAAPVIHADLGGPAADIQWYAAAYTLPFAMLLITGGRLGDIVGRRRVFRIGVTGFVLASVACALAGSAGTMIAARAVQGCAAALVIPQTFGLIKSMFTGPETARALGTIGPVMGLSAVCGPALGGILTHADLFGSSWRAVFLVNVPLGVAVLLAAPLLAEDRSPDRPRLALVGTALAAVGTGLVVYPLIAPGRHWTVLAVGVATLALFGLHQRRAAHPLIEGSLFGNRGFPAALVCSALFFAAMNGLMLVVVVHLQLGLGADVLTAGLTMLPWSGGMAVASWVAGAHLVPRYGARVMHAGLATMLTGVLGAVAVYATAGGYPWPLLGALAVCGTGLGLFTVPFFTTALHRVRPHETGSAAGLLNAVQQLGGTLGTALLGSVFLGTFAATGSATGAAGRAFWVGGGLLVATGVAVRVMTSGPRGVSPKDARQPAAAGHNSRGG
ncbi:MFS transporter [Longispora fulva]|uniref:EmrB/QacA subfamily drug resistance transporter n=1 Tax=Longispora fulva TaxID=619741 RepID=A0A8J7GI31_9ACTN|nr:MFS transporter [Longispora fulva]MBG6136778.1 EmrB/QacA subfamily drug resistance transporter [Longispora fulva]GIG59949.1 MFS transporter [Longispora fulva]